MTKNQGAIKLFSPRKKIQKSPNLKTIKKNFDNQTISNKIITQSVEKKEQLKQEGDKENYASKPPQNSRIVVKKLNLNNIGLDDPRILEYLKNGTGLEILGNEEVENQFLVDQ